MRSRLNLASLQALIIDIDGTLLRGKVPAPGLAEFFSFLGSQPVSFVVASNNTAKTANQYRMGLGKLGVRLTREQVVTAALATADYLKRELGEGATLFLIGEPALQEVMLQAGFQLSRDASQAADAVVVGGDSTLTYDKLKHAVLLLQRGAQLVGTNPDLLCPTEEGLVPEAGMTLAALEAATGAKPIVIGKPAHYLFDTAVKRMGREPALTAVLGDRLDTDILGGQRAGLKTILVTSGVDNEESITQKGIEPDLVVSGLDTLAQLWEKQLGQSNLGKGQDEGS
jgi:HAD superfamily hydrolase (TIGR01457 family)